MGAESRSTLFVWKIVIDICELLQESNTTLSCKKISEKLQAKYSQLDEKEREEFFRLSPGFARRKSFPDKQLVSQYIKRFESEFSIFHKESALISLDTKGNISRPNEEVLNKILSIGRGLYRELEEVTVVEPSLRLAASDSVTHYLLPRILGQANTAYKVNFRRFRVDEIENGLLHRDIDLAIGWNGYGSEAGPPKIHRETIERSTSQVHILFHPRQYQLAEMKKQHINSRRNSDPKGRDFCVTVEALKAWNATTSGILYYPEHLLQLRRIADNLLKARSVSSLDQVDSLAAVVNMVAAGAGIGLFCGLEWLLGELEDRHQILTAKLTLPTEWSIPDHMWLYYYTRKTESPNPCDQETVWAMNLIQQLTGLLSNSGHPEPHISTEWSIEPNGDKLAKSFKLIPDWFVYFVTSGQVAQVPYPQWMSGRLRFERTKDTDPLSGKLTLDSKPDEAIFMNATVLPEPLAGGSLMIRFERHKKVGKRLRRHTIAYFPCRVVRPNGPFAATCYLGSLNFAIVDSPFVSPIIISDTELTADQRLGIARCHHLTYLNGEMDWPAPALAAHPDTRESNPDESRSE